MAGRWLDVPAAAQELGISTDAVRKRIARGTLQSDTQDGRRVVWLDGDGSDESGTLKSETPASDALIEAKDETIRVLQEQLESERRANEENRRIIAALTSRIPQLEAPRESQEDAQEPQQEPGGVEGQEPRSWWQRWFGG
jgi:chromosome segregation ATPase